MMIHRKIESKKPVKTKTLLIVGEVLLKIGFHATRNTITARGRVKTVYHFLDTIRRFYQDFLITKVVVFWEGENSRAYRQGYYPYYKQNRDPFIQLTDDEYADLQVQRRRIKMYLEELYIRQIQEEASEADDCIAYYSQHSPNEHKIIFTNGKDLLQLLSEDTDVYLGDRTRKFLVTTKNFHTHFPYHYGNVAIIKMIGGDQADNISGIEGVAEITVLKLFPELKNEPKNVEWVRNRAKELLVEQPNNAAAYKILEGRTKWGTYANDYFAVMNEIINLNPPHVTPDGIADLEEIKESPIDPANRGGVPRALKMFMEDGIRLNNNDDAFFEFWQPFQIIIKKEQDYFKQCLITQ
jgi:5'-3' exonuclease